MRRLHPARWHCYPGIRRGQLGLIGGLIDPAPPEIPIGFIDRLEQTIEAGRLVDWPQASEAASKAI